MNLTDTLWGHVTEPFYWFKFEVSWVSGGGTVMQNLCMFGSQSKNGCPLIFHDFCTIRGKEQGTKAIWCFEKLQMALIRTYKICLPYSLRRRSGGVKREGNWHKKKRKEKSKTTEKANDSESHFGAGLSNQNFITFLFSSRCSLPCLPPSLPWCWWYVGSPLIPSLSGCCVIYTHPPPSTHHPQPNYRLQSAQAQIPER